MYLIHESANEEDPPPGAAQNILGGERIRDAVRIQTAALVGDMHRQSAGGGFKRHIDVFAGVVPISVYHRVHGCLTHRHGNVRHRILVKAGLRRELLGDLLNLVDALK